MDDGGHRENGRIKTDQYRAAQGQWLMHQPSMKQIMALMAERDAAIQERNLALSEKKAAIAERDMAFLQRDAAIAERNNAIAERDNAIANLQYRENSLSSGTSEAAKSRRGKRAKEAKVIAPNKKASKPPKKVKQETENLNKIMSGKSHEWKGAQDVGGASDDFNKQLVTTKPDWTGKDLGLNQVVFNESTMAPPVCSCTGVLRQCYKWGNGGWQSSCCTTALSMYPLPAVPNKKHARIGGRKMSGSAFNKLLTRLAAEGYDLSNPVDLKNHWAKHGTNRYITIK
ncbi:protein BASIC PENTACYSTEINE6-like isoform X3 [Hibiscus syriacus]|uniref:protein BASIC PENTACYSTEINE6-like isoform X3 n=1 Tax=Hibiscus syriacus TaxID=106335 RepID=UPI0019214426|nr:protein BASIC PENTACYSTEINE6-like isoform X3 [Hibiscus syriacus]